jgi:hypothetical protein
VDDAGLGAADATVGSLAVPDSGAELGITDETAGV